MKFVWLLHWISLRIALSQATNHWVVTETGLLQPKDNSPFVLENSFNLLSFLNQDTRWENIFNMYYNLIYKQKNINRLWIKLEYDASFDKFIAENKFCKKVGNIAHVDWYTSFLDDGKYKGIAEKDFALQKFDYGDTDVPDCKKISSLTFSMFAFEHLDSMINREYLNATPEYELPEMFAPIMTADQFGHWLSDVLRKNTSSWVHYNLASIFWRVKGNMPKALECSRRAVHNAPRQYKSIALLCMGSVLHRCLYSEDAAIVLGAAVDHDPEYPISHFALGGALAVIGDFNNSLIHLDLSIKLDTRFDLAEKFKDGIYCHMDMFKKIRIAQSTLKELSDALKEYHVTEIEWLKIQIAFLSTMKHKDSYDFKSLEINCRKMSQITGLNIVQLKKDGDKNTAAQYFIDSPTYKEIWRTEMGVAALDTAQSFQRLIKHIGPHAGLPTTSSLAIDETRNRTEFLKQIGPMPAYSDIFVDSNPYKTIITELKVEQTKTTDKTQSKMEAGALKPDKKKLSEEGKLSEKGKLSANEKLSEKRKLPEKGDMLYPSNLKVNRNKEIFDTDPHWPDSKTCEYIMPSVTANIEAIYPVFLPIENKGIMLDNLLTEQLGVPALVDHELPWHPPVCPTDKDLTHYTQRKGIKMLLVSEEIYKDILRTQLLKYLSDSHLDILKNKQDAEIGQRIQTAMEKEISYKWVLYTIASLYWRVRGNLPYAINCLLAASRNAEMQYRDVVLVSLASVFVEMGLVDEGAKLAEEAFRINPYEPATNFIIAQVNMINKNHKTHLFHLKQVIRVDSHFMGGKVRNILNGWSCVLKDVSDFREYVGLNENEVCAEVEPGVSMVCDRGGINCEIRNRYCYERKARESGQIVRMLELRDDMIQGTPVDDVGYIAFDPYIDAMPKDRTNKIAHQKNYDGMMRTVLKMLTGCEVGECSQIDPEDTEMKMEDCTFQHLQLDYWLQIISFQQHLTTADMKLHEDIAEITPSNKKVPDCRLPPAWESDFYLERIMRVDTRGWEPVLSLMHQFTEFFSSHDFATLGAKIAKYVDTRPSSWVGLIAAGWWCGASGRGACAARCLAAAHAIIPARYQQHALRPLTTLLHMQSKSVDAKEIAYLSFYTSPKNKVEAFLVAVSHAYRSEFDKAVWMFRYGLLYDKSFLPAKACLHISICHMLYGETLTLKINEMPT